jgi:hypothetical protein
LSTAVSEVSSASIIALMMEAARTSETSVANYFARQYILEDKAELQLGLYVFQLFKDKFITVTF